MADYTYKDLSVGTGTGLERLVLENGGTSYNIKVYDEGELHVVDGTASGTVISGGCQVIYAQGVAKDTQIQSGGRQQVFYGGHAENTVIENNATQWVNSSTADNSIVQSKGMQHVSKGSIVRETKIESGGTMRLYKSTAEDLTVAAGGQLIIYDGAVISGSLSTAGTVRLVSGQADLSHADISVNLDHAAPKNTYMFNNLQNLQITGLTLQINQVPTVSELKIAEKIPSNLQITLNGQKFTDLAAARLRWKNHTLSFKVENAELSLRCEAGQDGYKGKFTLNGAENAVALRGNTIYIYNGEVPQQLLLPAGAELVDIKDVNNDGLADIILLNQGRTTILYSDGNNGFITAPAENTSSDWLPLTQGFTNDFILASPQFATVNLDDWSPLIDGLDTIITIKK